jgi:hypothetical protein
MELKPFTPGLTDGPFVVWYSVSLLPPPHGSVAAPAQGVLQSAPAAATPPVAREFPQSIWHDRQLPASYEDLSVFANIQHSVYHSVPAYEYPLDKQNAAHISLVMAGSTNPAAAIVRPTSLSICKFPSPALGPLIGFHTHSSPGRSTRRRLSREELSWRDRRH